MGVSYTAAVLHEEDRDALLIAAGHRENSAMQNWIEKAHHMTMCMGAASGEISEWLNREVELRVVAFGCLFFEDGSGIAAVKVETDVPSKNSIKHITIAHANGVKPKQSNDITNWVSLDAPIVVRGLVREVEFARN